MSVKSIVAKRDRFLLERYGDLAQLRLLESKAQLGVGKHCRGGQRLLHCPPARHGRITHAALNLRWRFAKALRCRSTVLRSRSLGDYFFNRQSQRSRHTLHRSGVAAKFGGYPRCAKSPPGKPD